MPRMPFGCSAHVALSALLCFVSGCATTQSRISFLGEHYPPRAADVAVEVFRDGVPDRPFNRIARLDVHLEKTGFVTSRFEDALPELKKQARQAGADAVIEIQETRSQILETMVYHVTATGVRYVRAP
jgi:putative heavy-metal-binding protein